MCLWMFSGLKYYAVQFFVDCVSISVCIINYVFSTGSMFCLYFSFLFLKLNVLIKYVYFRLPIAMGRLLYHANYKFEVVRVLLWSHNCQLTSVLVLRVSRNWKKHCTNVMRSCQKRRNQIHQDSLWN
jgi:hypothetical protein